MVSAVRGTGLAVLSFGVSLSLFITALVSLALIPLGLGVFSTPWVLELVRAHANHRRALAHEWSGVPIAVPYRPLPPLAPGVTGQVERCVLLLKDPASWRDLLWLPVDTAAGTLLALLPPMLFAYGVEGWMVFAGVWQAVRGHGFWYGFIEVQNFGDAVQCAGLGTAVLLLAVATNPHYLRAHFLVAQSLLAPTRGARLARRVEYLYETRHDAVDSSAAELRRIERDLHDGAQARLVAMGMSLGTIEALVERDPTQAKKLIAQARENSAEALTELRDLVRGIHPPVLAERGLGDAAQALALRMELPVELDVELPGRFEEPVESAAYFALSEVLTNAAKHSGAHRIWVDIGYAHDVGGVLQIAVTDDGKGGASPDRGTGMKGVERRLGQFDGVFAVSSPKGGPTMVTMEIPCTAVPE
nr:histidine kinase [Streptomyces boncukensis]